MKTVCNFDLCKRKVSTFNTIMCQCGFYYCNEHRLMFDHKCTENTNKTISERHKIQTENPIITKDAWNLSDFTSKSKP